MTIGELLKKERLTKEKTQKEWVGNIVSTSYYAKVEKNVHRISAEDLLALLDYNNISTEEFFQELKDSQNPLKSQKNIWANTVISATYNNDLLAIKRVMYEIKKSDLPQDNKEKLLLESQGMIESVKMDTIPNYQTDQKFIQKIKKEIFSIPETNKYKLSLYANFIHLYDYETSTAIIRQILKKFDVKTSSTKEQVAIGTILVNYLSNSIETSHYDKLGYYFDFAQKLPITTDIYLIKCSIASLKNLWKYHFDHNPKYIENCRTIVKTYNLSGLKEVGKSVQELIDMEIKKQK